MSANALRTAARLGRSVWPAAVRSIEARCMLPALATAGPLASGNCLEQSYHSAAVFRGHVGPHLGAGFRSAEQRRGMFIQTQQTPNPSSLMFMPGTAVMESGSAEFRSPRVAMASPLAKRLFGIDGVTSAFFGSDFVTVSKTEDYNWSVLKPDIFAAIMDHFSSGEPLFTDATAAASDTAINDDDTEAVAMIKELLETRIRPAVQEDGGDIQFVGFDEDSGIVTLRLRGACSGCPSSSATLKGGIENMLMHYVPEVKQVLEAGPDEADQVGLSEFAKLEAQLSN